MGEGCKEADCWVKVELGKGNKLLRLTSSLLYVENWPLYLQVVPWLLLPLQFLYMEPPVWVGNNMRLWSEALLFQIWDLGMA